MSYVEPNSGVVMGSIQRPLSALQQHVAQAIAARPGIRYNVIAAELGVSNATVHVAAVKAGFLTPHKVARMRREAKPAIPRLERGLSPATSQALSLLRANSAVTYSTIAEMVGVSRERVRQIAKEYLRETAKTRIPQRKKNKALANGISRLQFQKLVQVWLGSIGSRWCGQCSWVRSLEEMSTPQRCKSCNNQATRENWANLPKEERQRRARIYNGKQAQIRKARA